MSKRLPKDQDARDYASGLDGGLERSMLVEAGAGTGKTTILVNRIINILKQGDPASPAEKRRPFKPERLAAITFTEKAAAETKARVRDELNVVIEKTKETQERYLLQSAYDRLERAQITTIHGFAFSLIRERPVEAGISPVADIISAVEREKTLEQCWERWLLDNLSDTADEPLEILFAAGLSIHNLRKAADIFISQRDIVAGAFDAEKPDILAEFKDLGVSFESELTDLRKQCSNPEDKLLIKTAEFSAAFAGAPSEKHGLYYYILNIDLPKTGRVGSKNNWLDIQTVRDKLTEYRERLTEIRTGLISWATADVVNRLNEYVAFYQGAKGKRGLLDFTDILIKCRDMLRDNYVVRDYFQRRFDYLLVDEFQDTDPIQAEIAFYLAEESPHADNWRDVKLKPGKLFLVGDPKQSIYRFRRADIAIYNKAAGLIGEKTDISVNFRCRPSVVEWVNRRFGPQMDGGEKQAEYIALHAHREENEPSVIIAECAEDSIAVFNGVTDGKLKKPEWQRAEAAFIAGYIRQSVEEGLQVHNKDGTARAAEYGDFALLFFSTSPIAYYEEALHRAGIPNELYRDKAYFERSEVNELISVLNALADPYDSAAVVGTLRSSFFGVSDTDLVRYRAAGGDFNYTRYDGMPVPAIADCFKEMYELRSLSTTAQPSYVLNRLFEITMNRPLHAIRERGASAMSNLDRLQKITRENETAGATTLPGLVRWLNKLSETKDEGDIPASSGDSVILNTVHSAKGLEYNIVILPNLINGFQGVATPGLLYYRGGESDDTTISIALKMDIHTSGYERDKDIVNDYLDAERARLAYVAATRARDCLVLPAFFPDKGRENTYAKYLLPEAGDYLGTKIISGADYLGTDSARQPIVEENDVPDISAEFDRWRRRMDTAFANIKNVKQRIINPSALAHGVKPKRSEDAELDEKPRNMPRRIGNALHYIMENADFGGEEQLGALLDKAVSEFKCETETEHLKKLARNCLASPPVAAARDAERLYRELNFVYPLEGRLIEGVVDLVYIIGDKLYIADYKSDAMLTEEVMARAGVYEEQMAHYTAALHSITGMEVAEVSLVFAAVPETVSLDLNRLNTVFEKSWKNVKG